MTEAIETNEVMETEKRKRAPSKRFYAFNGTSVFTNWSAQQASEAIEADSDVKIYEQTQVGAYDLTADTVNHKFSVKKSISYQG